VNESTDGGSGCQLALYGNKDGLVLCLKRVWDGWWTDGGVGGGGGGGGGGAFGVVGWYSFEGCSSESLGSSRVPFYFRND